MAQRTKTCAVSTPSGVAGGLTWYDGAMLDAPRADVLLVTVTRVESKAILETFAREEAPASQSIGGRIYFSLGEVNGARVWLTQSEMGSAGVGASQQAVDKGIAALSPVAVIMVGIAFGMNDKKQAVGDVLVTESLRLYELQRVGEHGGAPRIVLRGDRPHASPWLINHFRGAELTWNGSKLRFGSMLTGEKLIDDLDFREQLRALEPEAVGGEMEGSGLYVACHERKVDWILVKGICDWADGHKGIDKEAHQEAAARNSAALVLHALRFARVDWEEHRRFRWDDLPRPSYPQTWGPSMAFWIASGPLGTSTGGEPRPSVAKRESRESIPYRSSLPQQPFFFGREEELRVIADAIASESRTWGVLIDGPGGIGKSALAIRAGHVASAFDFDQKLFLSAKVRELTPTGEQRLTDFMLPNFMALLTELGHQLGNGDVARLPEGERANAVRHSLTDRRALLIIDNVETFPEPERIRLYQFLSRLPQGCKAIVTSRRRTDVDARTIRLDRLALKDALAFLGELAKTNRRLSAVKAGDRERLYEITGGNPLLLRWTVGQLGQTRGHCRSVDEACTFLERAPPGNDPLEYVFGDLLDTFTSSENAVLAALALFTLPVDVLSIGTIAGLAERQVRTALEDLTDRALVVGDPGVRTFVLPPLTATYLRRSRPQAISQSSDRLVTRAYTLVLESQGQSYGLFTPLETAWPMVAAALPLFLRGDNGRLQRVCSALANFLNFSGRWDEWLRLSHGAEARAVAAGDFGNAGWRAFHAGFTHHSRNQAAEVLECAERAQAFWKRAGAGPREQAIAIRLRGEGRELERDFEAAIADYTEAVELLRMINPEDNDVAIVLNDLASAERSTGDFAAAKRDYLEALWIASKNKHPEGVAIYTGNLAALALDAGDWPTAERLGQEALALAENISHQWLIGAGCYRLAKALARQHKKNEGLAFARRAVEVFSRLKRLVDLEDAEDTFMECSNDPDIVDIKVSS